MFSGAAAATADDPADGGSARQAPHRSRGYDALTIEGTPGFGDEFMLGRAAPTVLPLAVTDAVTALYDRAAALLGPVRMEWVADRNRVWVVQLHRGPTVSAGDVIVPGHARGERTFDVAQGLEALRALVADVAGTGQGIVLVGDVGITSHFGDVLRKAGIPSRRAGERDGRAGSVPVGALNSLESAATSRVGP